MERDAALGKLQHRNSVLTAKLEEKDLQIVTMEGKMTKLNRRLREADAYGPPAWIVKDAVRDGYGLEAMGLVHNNSNASMWHQVSTPSFLAAGLRAYIWVREGWEKRLREMPPRNLMACIQDLCCCLQ